MDRLLPRIYELKGNLLQLGYHSFELRLIIKESLGDSTPEEASPEEQENLIISLENYVKFAERCHKI